MKFSLLKLSTLFLLFPFTISMAISGNNKNYSLLSPNKQVESIFSFSPNGNFTYTIQFNGSIVIENSPIGFVSDKEVIPSAEWKITDIKRNRVKKIWTPIWGKRNIVTDNYSEIEITIASTKASMILEARVYNDGVAFRYKLPDAHSMGSLSEITTFRFAGDYTAWYYNGERHNIGPEKLSETASERLPVMTIKASDDIYLALHEAYLTQGSPLKLISEKDNTEFKILTTPFTTDNSYVSAWRVIMCGDTPGVLIDSHIIELLNPEPMPNIDFSWVKPGIALWDWRINGAIWENYRYKMDYPSWVRMIDFAAESGFSYLVLDANWYGPEFSKDSDPIKGDKVKDVKQIIQYGKTKNIGVWLYLNDVAGSEYPIEETLAQYGEWGAAGVKYGFMNGSEEEKNQKTIKITELCARNRLLVNFHDYPIHPWGQARTWPNAVTREYCKAQLDGHDVFYPRTFVTSVFVNMLAGPLDMNNGMFDLRQGRTTRVDNNQEVPSTLAAEAARTLITYSGVTIIPDIPEYYKKYPSLLRFLSAQQMPWLESSTLDGVIGEYIVMMRQASTGEYLIGAATNEQARTLTVSLDFLPRGRYSIEIVEDGEDADYKNNRETIRERIIDKTTRKNLITLHLAPGGGACVRITKL
ncbi:MAG TPA: glycoside hydrolase family 97 catalytic domain-containing protein [Bacteroidaceae bacterium]|nr:glycoside hydrolase family 97 catalytic domain-containing protein [Bacteroidaceae bacterium]